MRAGNKKAAVMADLNIRRLRFDWTTTASMIPLASRGCIDFSGNVGRNSPVIPRSAPRSAGDVGQTTSAESPLAKMEIPSLRSE